MLKLAFLWSGTPMRRAPRRGRIGKNGNRPTSETAAGKTKNHAWNLWLPTKPEHWAFPDALRRASLQSQPLAAGGFSLSCCHFNVVLPPVQPAPDSQSNEGLFKPLVTSQL